MARALGLYDSLPVLLAMAQPHDSAVMTPRALGKQRIIGTAEAMLEAGDQFSVARHYLAPEVGVGVRSHGDAAAKEAVGVHRPHRIEQTMLALNVIRRLLNAVIMLRTYGIENISRSAREIMAILWATVGEQAWCQGRATAAIDGCMTRVKHRFEDRAGRALHEQPLPKEYVESQASPKQHQKYHGGAQKRQHHVALLHPASGTRATP